MAVEKLRRVSKKHPCPVCGKPDWCLVAEDGSAAICPRIQEGSVKKCGDAGWLHILSDNDKKGHKKKTFHSRILNDFGNRRDFGTLAKHYQELLTPKNLDCLARSLCVSKRSLERLSVGWDGKAYTFPMSNDFGKIIGIRRRFLSGRKVSTKHSKTGLFIPSGLPKDGLLLICEGPTDTATALDLGFAAIGRPNCHSRIEMTAKFARGREAVIISDNDNVGQTGSKRLARVLSLFCPSVKIVYPPGETKDLRQWLKTGLSKEILQELIQKIKPIEIRISFKD